MTRIHLSQIETPDQINAVRDLVREFFDFALTQDPDAGKAHAFDGLEDQLAALPGMFAPPSGGFLLATVGEAPAGCVAFFGHDAQICEVKRMYVRPEFRGLHLGETLISNLISMARTQGYQKIILDTFHTLKAAQHLYEKAGFTFVPPRITLPPEHEGKVVFMEMTLT
ncbi:GNAT family N-acetyltransferase [Roseovarius rhodophyticola]|uniref:GNAT family N-acetyltransferase n=1 Tax=Roseovarius rhodophyticola TaxID=3080827 RepID=A0ABZ2TEX2_9RHOB|nr:GNAT family N-acetyltransferase [Roseovarius sp. W115]MDV2928475.1 GNAT family N-acetyltransferase [Roseovarius sp. W115]